DHFGLVWNLRRADGEVAHTGCVAFGMDRLAVAMFCVHGLEPVRWPESARRALRL
ncbi:serine--tRNA ligase protein, partial [mine drainage metagenome]